MTLAITVEAELGLIFFHFASFMGSTRQDLAAMVYPSRKESSRGRLAPGSWQPAGLCNRTAHLVCHNVIHPAFDNFMTDKKSSYTDRTSRRYRSE
jgi:hypothetical protein